MADGFWLAAAAASVASRVRSKTARAVRAGCTQRGEQRSASLERAALPVPSPVVYWARSLPPSNLDDATGFTCNYHTNNVLKAFKVEAGPAAPAFGQPGLGLQYQLVASLLPGDPAHASVQWLLVHGYLAATN